MSKAASAASKHSAAPRQFEPFQRFPLRLALLIVPRPDGAHGLVALQPFGDLPASRGGRCGFAGLVESFHRASHFGFVARISCKSCLCCSRS
jgi:hypothetical protein